MQNYSVLREKLNFETYVQVGDDLAFLTHFLQNSKNNASLYYSAKAEEVYAKTVKANMESEDLGIMGLLPMKWDVPFPPPENPFFTFIDLFAGIGGFRIALQQVGGKCVFSSEYNLQAQRAYELNFGEIPFGDITKFNLGEIPDHDVLCAGFPCQPFSISGKKRGFEDARGTLIYSVFEVIKLRQPKVVFLENVKHLVYHDGGRTLALIVESLEEFGYKVSQKVLNAKDFGVPQNRERIIIVCHKQKQFDFEKLKTFEPAVLEQFLEKAGDFEYLNEPYTLVHDQRKQKSGLIFAGYRDKKIRITGVRPGTEHLSRVHKQPNRIYSSRGTHPALPSQESSGRFWIWHEGKVRKLTIRECYRIMGFPEEFKFSEEKGTLYKQIGNSVCIPMINSIGLQIKEQLLA